MIGRALLGVVWLAAVLAGGLLVVGGVELVLAGRGDGVLLGAIFVVVGGLLVYAFGASLLDLLERRFGP